MWGPLEPFEDWPCTRYRASSVWGLSASYIRGPPAGTMCPPSPRAVSWAELCGPTGTHTGFLRPQQVNMPYVMIPAFPPSHQPLPVTPESQLALPIQPIPCKPGEWGGVWLLPEAVLRFGKEPGTAVLHSFATWPSQASLLDLSSGRRIPSF